MLASIFLCLLMFYCSRLSYGIQVSAVEHRQFKSKDGLFSSVAESVHTEIVASANHDDM